MAVPTTMCLSGRASRCSPPWKLLGRPTAFVVVDGEDHHITDYNKRIKWHNTIMAWFQRYLKGDASWWNALYKKVEQ